MSQPTVSGDIKNCESAKTDIEKRKGKRRRSARFYVNANRPVDPEAAALIADFPSDPDEDDDAPVPPRARRTMRPDEVKRDFSQAERKRLAAQGQALADGSYPVPDEDALRRAAILARTGHGDAKAAKKLIRRRAKELGVPDPLESSQKAAGNPAPHPSGGSWTDRLSPSRVAGQGAASTGDHNAAFNDPMNQPGPAALALGHPSMRQSSTVPFPLGMMQTYNGDNEFGDKDVTLGMGRVQISRLDAASAAGLSGPPGNPFGRRMDHSAPIGASNGSHSLANPTSTPRPSMKNSDAVAAMKRHMFPGSGGAR